MNKITTHIEHGSSRPQEPDRIIVHARGEFLQGAHAVDFLANTVKLSAHALIAPDATNYRCREDNEGAWHARGFNSNSLGIEFLVPGDHDYGSFLKAIDSKYLAEDQYQAGVTQVREWITKFDIKHVDRHCDLSPGRKLDPGAGFPWNRFLIDIGWDI